MDWQDYAFALFARVRKIMQEATLPCDLLLMRGNRLSAPLLHLWPSPRRDCG